MRVFENKEHSLYADRKRMSSVTRMKEANWGSRTLEVLGEDEENAKWMFAFEKTDTQSLKEEQRGKE